MRRVRKGRGLRHIRRNGIQDPSHGQNPYRALWAGVLEQAIRDWREPEKLSNHQTDYAVRSLALHWFFSDRQTIGSFRFVCEVLDLDCDSVRRRIFGEDKAVAAG